MYGKVIIGSHFNPIVNNKIFIFIYRRFLIILKVNHMIKLKMMIVKERVCV